jgi:hypothetical protein
LAQSCACSEAVARGRSKAAANSLRERGIVSGIVRVMGRSVVRGKEAGQGKVIDFSEEILLCVKRCRGDDRFATGWRDWGVGLAFILRIWGYFICELQP